MKCADDNRKVLYSKLCCRVAPACSPGLVSAHDKRDDRIAIHDEIKVVAPLDLKYSVDGRVRRHEFLSDKNLANIFTHPTSWILSDNK